MLDLVRDSTFGQIVNWASNGRLLPYRDQRSDYVIPDKYLPRHSTAPGAAADSPLPRTVSQAPTLASGAVTLVDAPGVCQEHKKVGSEAGDVEKQLQDVEAPPALPPSVRYPWLVDWEENDPDRPLCVFSPVGSCLETETSALRRYAEARTVTDCASRSRSRRNWSPRKRLFVASLVMLLTFSVYVGSAIYTPSIPGIMEEFGIGQVGATSGLTLFVAAYGLGPMLLSPMQEIPRWGRTPVYIIGLALFVVFQIPEILAKNVATILVFRFLSGLVGSPALATGGASMADIYSPQYLAYAVGAWGSSSFSLLCPMASLN